jgi:hypothetical protein
MCCVLVLYMTSDDRSSGAWRFFDIAARLCLAVGNAIRPGFIQESLAVLVVRRIFRIRAALLALEARYLVGTLRRRPVAVAVTAGDVREPVVRVAAVMEMPRGFAWLCPLVPSYAATYGNHIRLLLAEPGMQELLLACPQAVRILRPLCVMLGIERSDYVPAGAEPVRVRARVARVRKVREARWAFDQDAEDAHYAISGVPRRWRLRAGRGLR